MKHSKPSKVVSLPSQFQTLTYNQATSQVKFLQGKVLTAIESWGLSPSQEKAAKDIVKDYFGECMNMFWRHSIGQQVYPPDVCSTRE